MKIIKIITAIIALALTGCEKKNVKPAQPAPVNNEVLLNYQTSGFVNNVPGGETVVFPDKYGNQFEFNGIPVIDSCAIYINGKLSSQHTFGYHIYVNKGDVVSFYLSGKVADTSDCYFVVWPDLNEKPDKRYFYQSGGLVVGSYTVY